MGHRNGTVVVRTDSFAGLQAAQTRGLVNFANAPAIEEVFIPEVEEIALPAVVSVNDGRSRLQDLALKIKGKRDDAKKVFDDKLRQRKEAQQKQREQVDAFIEFMRDNHLRGLCDIYGAIKVAGSAEGEKELLDSSADEVWPRPDEKKLTIREQRDEWRGEIDKYQNHKSLVIALPVIIAEAEFWLSVEPLTRTELERNLEALIKGNVLQKNEHGEIRAFGIKLSLSKRFLALEPLYQSELQGKIRMAVANQVKRISDEAVQAQKKIFTDFWAQADTTPKDFFEGKKGSCCFPAEDGGVIVGGDDEQIWLVDAMGRHERELQILRNLEAQYGLIVEIPRQLKNEQGQLRNENSELSIQVPEAVVNETDRRNWHRSCRFIFDKCREGLLAARFLVRDMVEPKMVRMYKRINVVLNPDQFYHFKPKPLGKYTATIPQWKWRLKDAGGILSNQETVVENLELQFERFEDSEQNIRLKVVGYSAQHKDFLEATGSLKEGGYVDDEESGVDHPMLVRLLRMDHAIRF